MYMYTQIRGINKRFYITSLEEVVATIMTNEKVFQLITYLYGR